MVTIKNSDELFKEAERLYNLASIGKSDVNELKAFFQKFLSLREFKPKPISKRKQEQDALKQQWDEWLRLHEGTRIEAFQLQGQFNLAVPPHYKRVLEYRRTHDPKVFDGLKRTR